MTWPKKKTAAEPTIPPPTPKPLTFAEQLKMQMNDVEAIIAAKTAEREAIMRQLLWLEFTPHAEEQMKAIWERLKPRT